MIFHIDFIVALVISTCERNGKHTLSIWKKMNDKRSIRRWFGIVFHAIEIPMIVTHVSISGYPRELKSGI
jgi:hypothetical protein